MLLLKISKHLPASSSCEALMKQFISTPFSRQGEYDVIDIELIPRLDRGRQLALGWI